MNLKCLASTVKNIEWSQNLKSSYVILFVSSINQSINQPINQSIIHSFNLFCPEIQDTGPDTKGGYNLHLQLPVKQCSKKQQSHLWRLLVIPLRNLSNLWWY